MSLRWWQSQNVISSKTRVCDVHSIESIVFDQLDRTGDEGCAESRVGDESEVSILGVRPATD